MQRWSAPALASAAVMLALVAAASRRERDLLGDLVAVRPAGPRHVGLARRIGAVPALGRLAGAERLGRLVATADDARAAEEVIGVKFLAAAATMGAALALSGSLLPSTALGLVAFRAPDIRIARAAKRRRARADRELPLFLDLLAAATAAGLSGQMAVRRATEATEGPLAEELSSALRRVDLGGRWRDELTSVTERLDLPDLRRAAAVLTRSESIGSSLAEALSDLAHESREARRATVAERARKAPVKMLFPLVFLVLPAFLLLTVVPVLVTTVQSIR